MTHIRILAGGALAAIAGSGAAGADPAQGTVFAPWGSTHVAALALFALVTMGSLAAAGRLSPSGKIRLRKLLACTLLAVQVPFQVYSMLPPHWSLARSLPFELCDLAWMAAAVALWTGRRPWTELTYYWGLTLTSQAMLTPRLERDFPEPQFLMFWFQHSLIVLAAVYLTWGLALRPSWRGYRVTAAITLAWLVVMLLFNAAAGTNYLFVNEKPPRTILDFLGPWPWYVAAESGLVLLVWAAMTWPWVRTGPATDVPAGIQM